MPRLLTPKHLPGVRNENRITLRGMENNLIFISKIDEQFKIIERRYRPAAWQKYASFYHFDLACTKLTKIIKKSGLFDNEIKNAYGTEIRKHLEGLDDLRALLNGAFVSCEKPELQEETLALIKNFCEGFWWWFKTAKDFSSPPPGWTPPSGVENPKLAELRSMSKKERKKYWNEL